MNAMTAASFPYPDQGSPWAGQVLESSFRADVASECHLSRPPARTVSWLSGAVAPWPPKSRFPIRPSAKRRQHNAHGAPVVIAGGSRQMPALFVQIPSNMLKPPVIWMCVASTPAGADHCRDLSGTSNMTLNCSRGAGLRPSENLGDTRLHVRPPT